MIDPALTLLARLRLNAWARRVKRGLSTKRGIAFFCIGIALFAMWMLPLLVANVAGHEPTQRVNSERVRDVMPLILLGITLMMAVLTGGKFISFTPAEVDFLFPGPFHRRELVLWKIALTGFAAIWVALIFSIWQSRFASLWIAAFLGIWLAWMFAQSLAMLILLARQAIKANSASPSVRFMLFAFFAALLSGVIDLLRPVASWFRGSFSFADFLAHKRESLPARALMAPFDALTMTFTAERIAPDLLMWMGVSAAMIASLILCILRLDAYFIETSLRASEAIQATLERMKRGGGPFSSAKPITALRVPMLPWLGGAGPIAWRQFTLAARNARGILFISIVLVAGVGPFVWMMDRTERAFMPILVMVGFWSLFLLPAWVRFDFRGDLAHVENLKLLPLSPIVIAIGQMLAPVVTLIVLMGAMIAGVMIVVPDQSLVPGTFALLSLPPLILFLIGVENIVFLMFPTSQQMATPGDMSMMGRSMVVLFVKAFAILAVLGLVAAIASVIWAVSDSATISFFITWILLVCAACATVPIVARLFDRLDTSVDLPP